MEINGMAAEDVIGKKLKFLSPVDPTPESEAEFNERERQRMHDEGLARVDTSNKLAEVPKRYWDASFSKYPSEISEEARALCLKEDSDTIFILYGTTGRGKTTTLCSAIHARAYAGICGSFYFTMRNLEMRLRKCRTYGTDEDEETFMRHLSNIPFLCLDEVGTCLNKVDEVNFLRNIISARYDNMLPTWIATNLTPIEFKAYLSGVDITGKSREELKQLNDDLVKNVVILNRIKSVAVEKTLVGESFRGVQNADRSNAE